MWCLNCFQIFWTLLWRWCWNFIWAQRERPSTICNTQEFGFFWRVKRLAFWISIGDFLPRVLITPANFRQAVRKNCARLVHGHWYSSPVQKGSLILLRFVILRVRVSSPSPLQRKVLQSALVMRIRPHHCGLSVTFAARSEDSLQSLSIKRHGFPLWCSVRVCSYCVPISFFA